MTRTDVHSSAQLCDPSGPARHLNGPGGDLNAIIVTAANPSPMVLVGQGRAPQRATIEHFRSEGLELVPGAGGLAAAVPGAVDAWLLLLRDHGTLELADVWSYVLSYAERGYPLVPRVGATVVAVRTLFTEHWTTSAEFWLPDGRPPSSRTLMSNPAYATVLRRLLEAGASAPSREARIGAARLEWATGLVAESAVAFLSKPHRHSSHSGVISKADFASHRASWEPATTGSFRGYTVTKTGAWGQGPVLLQALKILEGLSGRRARPPDGRRRASPPGGAQARFRRPGGLLRRPGRRGR